MNNSKIYLSAGEASGDLHAARLVTALRDLDPTLRFVGLGGEQMERAGVELRDNLVDRAVMGVRRVFGELGALVGIAGEFLEELRREPPELVVLIDYPGLNLNLARMARRRGIPVVYYICPQVWAWAPWRMRRIAARADRLLVILPFEEDLYRRVHADTRFVANPLFDLLAAEEARRVPPRPERERLLALFPGSRRQEVAGALPVMLRVARSLLASEEDLALAVSCQRPALEPEIRRALAAAGLERARVAIGSPHELERQSHLSLVVSGTATLEHAYFGVPMVVVYPVRAWERRVFGLLSVTPFVALVNLYAGRRIVPEFLFTAADERAINAAARALLAGPERARVQAELRALKERSFRAGGARAAAESVLDFVARRRAGNCEPVEKACAWNA
ncbi:MAG: lipid-A-disaccharide synthase [Planctomycetes bacterium]|nr:lipid-A-disaccharide synthase [Planctomycetota bacterium]